MRNIRIAPSILAADFTKLGAQAAEAESAGADLFHIDVMDGRFVPNITMGPLVVAAMRRATTLPLDVHLMIVEPERYIEAFAEAGASSISVHIEACPNLHQVLQQIHDAGCQAGVAVNPHTRPKALDQVMDLVDMILVMTVNPGFGGQTFLTSMLPKLVHFTEMIKKGEREISLGVDGGINLQTIGSAVHAGADMLVAGSAVFGHSGGIASGIAALRQAAQPGMAR